MTSDTIRWETQKARWRGPVPISLYGCGYGDVRNMAPVYEYRDGLAIHATDRMFDDLHMEDVPPSGDLMVDGTDFSDPDRHTP